MARRRVSIGSPSPSVKMDLGPTASARRASPKRSARRLAAYRCDARCWTSRSLWTRARRIVAYLSWRAPRLPAGSVRDRGGGLAGATPPVAGAAAGLPVVDRYLAAQDDHGRPAVHLPAVPRAVVGAVKLCGAQRAAQGVIEDHEIGVAARS